MWTKAIPPTLSPIAIVNTAVFVELSSLSWLPSIYIIAQVLIPVGSNQFPMSVCMTIFEFRKHCVKGAVLKINQPELDSKAVFLSILKFTRVLRQIPVCWSPWIHLGEAPNPIEHIIGPLPFVDSAVFHGKLSLASFLAKLIPLALIYVPVAISNCFFSQILVRGSIQPASFFVK